MPRYFFDIKDGHRLVDPNGQDCRDDLEAIERATTMAIGVGLDSPQVDSNRHIAIINSEGAEVGRVPVYSKPRMDAP